MISIRALLIQVSQRTQAVISHESRAVALDYAELQVGPSLVIDVYHGLFDRSGR